MLSFLLFNQVSRSAADIHTFGCHRSNWKINNLTSISVVGALDYPLTPISGRRGKWRRPFRRLMKCGSRTLKDDFGGLDEDWTSEYDIKEISFHHKFKLRSSRRDDGNPRECVSLRCSTAMFKIFVFFTAIISSQRARLFCLNSLSLYLGCYVNNPLLGQMRCFSQTRQTSIFNDIVSFSFFLHPSWCAVCIHQIIQTQGFFSFVCCVTLWKSSSWLSD